jgi:hypothetical protein
MFILIQPPYIILQRKEKHVLKALTLSLLLILNKEKKESNVLVTVSFIFPHLFFLQLQKCEEEKRT